jgi:class 3 adenylate cyclase
LFTDIEGSTRLWQQHPEAMTVALARHDVVVREAVDGSRGIVFATGGDGFAAAFWTPGEAVAAAVTARNALALEPWPEPVVIRARMGIHTGTATEREGDYFGPTLNRAARIMAAGHGGQVLTSDATARLLSSAELVDLGEHRLKDLAESERIWQIGSGVFPPLRARRHRAGNLPSKERSLVGRLEDCNRLAAEVESARVVTLTGVGNCSQVRVGSTGAACRRSGRRRRHEPCSPNVA